MLDSDLKCACAGSRDKKGSYQKWELYMESYPNKEDFKRESSRNVEFMGERMHASGRRRRLCSVRCGLAE